MDVPNEIAELFFGEQTPAPRVESDPRTLYASFPPTLKAAMKVAAERNDWCRKTWAFQTEALADAMTRGWTADELADAYRAPPPPDRF